MINFKTNGLVPQVSRSSHTRNRVSLKDSEEVKNSPPSILIQNKFKLNLANYNIRTITSTEHLEELEMELSHMK